MDKINVYEKPTCTTCRRLVKLLEEKGIEFERTNYFIDPFTKDQLQMLLKKMDMKPGELLRKNEEGYKRLKFRSNDYSDDQALNFMIEDQTLIQRPIVEFGEKAVLARPVENVNKLF